MTFCVYHCRTNRLHSLSSGMCSLQPGIKTTHPPAGGPSERHPWKQPTEACSRSARKARVWGDFFFSPLLSPFLLRTNHRGSSLWASGPSPTSRTQPQARPSLPAVVPTHGAFHVAGNRTAHVIHEFHTHVYLAPWRCRPACVRDGSTAAVGNSGETRVSHACGQADGLPPACLKWCFTR